MLELHSDPYKFQKLAFGCMMTKKGEDYHEGGFYVMDQNDNKIDIEELLKVKGIAVLDNDKNLRFSGYGQSLPGCEMSFPSFEYLKTTSLFSVKSIKNLTKL